MSRDGSQVRPTKTPNPAPEVRGHPEAAPDLPGLVANRGGNQREPPAAQ